MAFSPRLLNRIIITIEANNPQAARKVLYGSLLNQYDVNNLLNSFFNEYTLNQDIYLETLTLNLGEISFHDFNLLFPVRLNYALKQALSKYQLYNNEDGIHLKESTPRKLNHKLQLSGNDCLIDIEGFIHYLHRKDSLSNPMEAITNNKITDANIKKFIDQLTWIENKWVLLLAKSCLSEQSLQRLLAIRQPDLLNTISFRLSGKVNISLYQEEYVSSEQLILNALGYIQRHNTQDIPKPDTQVISRITTGLNNGALNIVVVIELFRQAEVHNSSLDEWLEQLWQTKPISQLCEKHLSIWEYKNLLNRFNYKNPRLSEHPLQQMISVDSTFTEILQALVTEHKQNLPQLNQHQLSLIATAIQQGEVKTQNILQLFQHPALSSSAGTAWLAPLWQLAPVSQLCKKHLSVEEYQYLSERFVSNREDKNKSSQKSIMTSKPILLPEQTLPHQVNNAGILVLWPMLPQLFNQLGLLETQKFIHRQAQFDAVDFLDYLIWGTEEVPEERKVLNSVLCGLMSNETTESVCLELEKQLIAEQWLDSIIVQLPTWKKLSCNDVRQLFLQRPGELLISEQEIKITIQHQPFDVLLADWPWPLNIAKLPWLECPLFIDWQNI
ncbi:contractile injection system tape measure protein [Photorhabdus sp. RM71S]|uniref:contractile injection system tape measure protein n=1 Tax=Photorhabdus sp. RM71S TaxID=3342824 RepID=UPI0036DD9F24